MNVNSNPNYRVCLVRLLEQVHKIPAHTKTTNRVDHTKTDTKICFTEVQIHYLLPKLLPKHSESYSTLRNSLGCESIPPHFH